MSKTLEDTGRVEPIQRELLPRPQPESVIKYETILVFLKSLFTDNVLAIDTFEGVHTTIRPSLDFDLVSPDQQMPILIEKFATFLIAIIEAIRSNRVFVPMHHQQHWEDTQQTRTERRLQVPSMRKDKFGWIPQLYIEEVLLSDATIYQDPSQRLDRRLRAQLAEKTEKLRKLAETNVPQAAEQLNEIAKACAEIMSSPFESISIIYQLGKIQTSDMAGAIRPILGICIERSMEGYRVAPIVTLSNGRYITDRDSSLRLADDQAGAWIPAKTYHQLTIAKVVQAICDDQKKS